MHRTRAHPDVDTNSSTVVAPNITPVVGLPVGTRDGDGGNAAGGSAGTAASNGNGSSGAQSSGGSGSQTDPSVGGSGGGVAQGGDNGASPSELPDCSLLLDPEFEAEPLEIVITNVRDVPIGLSGPSQCQATLMTVHSADNNLLWGGDHCASTCEMIISETESCTRDCPSPDAVILKPGDSTTLSWHGVALDWMVLPSECCSESGSCPQTCGVPKLAEAGSYVATMAILELSEEQVEACESDWSSEQCPDVLTGQGNPSDTSDVPFEITSRSEPVMIDID